MNSQQEIEYCRIYGKAEKEYLEDLHLFRNNPHKHPIDEPVFRDYIINEFHKYIKNKYE
jgi:hypothetical protein